MGKALGHRGGPRTLRNAKMASFILDYILSFLRLFDGGFARWIVAEINKNREGIEGRVVSIDNTDDLGIISIDDLVVKHPELKPHVPMLKDHAMRLAKDKLKAQTNGMTIVQSTTTEQFTKFSTGVKCLIKPLLTALGKGGFATEDLVKLVIDTFTEAVSSGGWILYSYHDGHKTVETYEVKDDTARGGTGGIKLAYLHLDVEAKKVGGYIYDDSKTTVKYVFKTLQFVDLNSMIRWLM